MRWTTVHDIPPDWTRVGQAITIAKGFIAIVVLGIFWGLSKEIMDPLNAKRKEHITNPDATTGLDWMFQIWENYLFVALAIVVVGGIVFAVYARRGV